MACPSRRARHLPKRCFRFHIKRVPVGRFEHIWEGETGRALPSVMRRGESGNRNETKHQGRAFVCREVQRKGCFAAVQRVGKRCFRAVRIQQHQRIAVQ